MRGHPITASEAQQILDLRADGHTHQTIASVIGRHEATVRKVAGPGRPGKVPVEPLRKAFLKSDRTAYDVAKRMGWVYRDRRRDSEFPDAGRVLITLGLAPGQNSKGVKSWRTLADAETVGLLAEAVGVASWEVMPEECSCAPPIGRPGSSYRVEREIDYDCPQHGAAIAESEKEN